MYSRSASQPLHSTPTAILVGIAILIIAVSVVLHLLISRRTDLTELPTVLLLGPSGSGKTTLATALERGTAAETHTSQASLKLEIELDTELAEKSSATTPTKRNHQTCKKFLLIDTPGHGKLRQLSLQQFLEPSTLKGIIFLVDGSNVGREGLDVDGLSDGNLRDCAEYLHDVLLILQKRNGSINEAAKCRIRVLIAVNKLDLFTATPAPVVRRALEREIGKIRMSRSRALLDSGVALDPSEHDEEGIEWLGEPGEDSFSFAELDKWMERPIEIIGGWSSRENPNVNQWKRWLLELI